MAKRYRMSRGSSKKVYRKGVSRVHKKNFVSVMRGGYRI